MLQKQFITSDLYRNPFSASLLNSFELLKNLPFSGKAFLPSSISSLATIIVIFILLFLWPYGWIPVLARSSWVLIKNTRAQIYDLNLFDQTAYAIPLSLYFIIWSLFTIASIPFYVISLLFMTGSFTVLFTPVFDDWKKMVKDLFVLLVKGLTPSNLLYFVFVIGAIGGEGAWMELLKSTSDMKFFWSSVVSFSLTVAATVSVNLILSTGRQHEMSKAVRLFLFCMAISVAVITIIVLNSSHNLGILSIIDVLLTSILWLTSNSINPMLVDYPTNSSIGGNIEPKDDLSGNLRGVKH